MTIDLKNFCSTDENRYDLHKPFSRGEFTYATNGHVAVRVPRLPDVDDGGTAAENIFPSNVDYAFTPVPAIDLPPDTTAIEEEDCEDCDGSGQEHDCPDCQCECANCGGNGVISNEKIRVSVGIGAGIYNGRYVALLLTLPGLKLGPTTAQEPLHFRFDGGDGLLMPMRSRLDVHVDATLKSEAA